MTKRAVILAVAGALALAGQPALASGRGGGGHPSGGGGHSGGGHPSGGHSGGGYAVPRGSVGHYAPGGISAARHPSGGSGHYGGHGYYSYGHGGHGSYGHGYYGHGYYSHGYGHSHYGYGYYYPYYPYYGYGGYYGSGFGLYLGFGGPYAYGSMYYGAPYGDPSGSTNVYVGSPDNGSEDPGYRRPDDARASSDYVPNTGRVRLEVRPEDASVYVDDQFWGNASESRQLTLRAGRHVIELVRPGFPVARREVDVISGQSSDVLVDLQHHQQ